MPLAVSALPVPPVSSAVPFAIAAPGRRDVAALIGLINVLAEERGRLFIQPVDPESGPAMLGAHLETIAKSGAEVVLVAKLRDDLVGLVTGLRGAHPARRGVLEVGIGVRADCRGRGAGLALLTAIEQWAQAAGCHRLSLSVVTSNAPAIGLYRKFGFEIEGVQRGSAMLDGTRIDELLMGKALPLTAEPAGAQRREP